MNKDFSDFQKTFKSYQKLFGLTGYKVYFKYEPIDTSFASITVAQEDMVATARLNSKLPDSDKPLQDVKGNAKHEALHLLLSKLEDRASYRYATAKEIYETVEELVFKLEELIPDIKSPTIKNKG